MVQFIKVVSTITALLLSTVTATDLVYDYIIVGGGTGGGTLAVELAKKGHKTLIVEAGPDRFDVLQKTPFFHAASSEDPAITFDFNVRRYNDTKTEYFYPRVGALGGCSIHNAMVTVYPNTRDFELMADITGDQTWKEKHMRKYFKQIENNQFISQVNPEDHGTKGFHAVSYMNYPKHFNLTYPLNSLAKRIVPEEFVDVNGYRDGKLTVDTEGKLFIPLALDNTKFERVDYPQYLKDATKKYPLTIMTDTFVTKIMFDQSKTARGVLFRKGRYLYKASPLATEENRKKSVLGMAFATKEIIVAAGVYNTPQLLMLSGVGEAAQLKKHKIPVISDLPGVGRNMMDRYELPIVIKYPKNLTHLQGCKFNAANDDPCWTQYKNGLKGPYVNNGLVSGELKKSNPSLNEPDIFLINLLGDFHGYFRGYAKNLGAHPEAFTRLVLKAHTSNTNGQLTLRSSDPFDTPDINFNYFTDNDDDLKILIQELQAQRDDFNAYQDPHEEMYPGKNVTSDKDILQYIKDYTWGHHASCTCKIGKDGDKLAVLDPKFRVRGVKNLRVVDASAFPKIPGYFPVLYVHLIALKVADMITGTA